MCCVWPIPQGKVKQAIQHVAYYNEPCTDVEIIVVNLFNTTTVCTIQVAVARYFMSLLSLRMLVCVCGGGGVFGGLCLVWAAKRWPQFCYWHDSVSVWQIQKLGLLCSCIQ